MKPRSVLIGALAGLLLGACTEGRAPERVAAVMPDGGATLRVVSFNAWCAPPPLSEDLAGRLARMPAALRALDGDVICLQEVWLPDARARLERALSPEYTAAQSPAGGLMVLSRLPIVAERFTRFPDVPGMSFLQGLTGKGMLEVRIETGQGPMHVVDAHLVSDDAVGRDGQLVFLLGHVPRDLPLIVAADTNFWKVWHGAFTPQYESVLAAGFRDAAPPRRVPDGGLDPGAPTRPGWPRGQRDAWGPTFPDHIFYLPAPGEALRATGFHQALDTPEAALSDHNALVAEFHLDRTQQPD